MQKFRKLFYRVSNERLCDIEKLIKNNLFPFYVTMYVKIVLKEKELNIIIDIIDISN